ncbi:MAG TPA: hypothetical protein PKH10_05605 [bacterium]|nr:hypothetical protein [bacterium]
MRRCLPIIALLFLVAAACAPQGSPATAEGVRYFSVSFAPGTDTGTPSAPLPETTEYAFAVTVEARDLWGDRVTGFSGEVEVSLLGATLRSYRRISLMNGTSDPVTVRFGDGYRVERIAVTAIATEKTIVDAREIRLPTGPVGVSDPIYLISPRIPAVQGSLASVDDGGPSRLEKRNLTIRGPYDTAAGRHRDLVVIAAIEGGFYLSETDCEEFCSIYLYTHSTPYVEDGDDRAVVAPGMLLAEVNGSVFEYFGFTELSFPTFTPRRDGDGRILRDPAAIPAPRDVTACVDAADDLCLEGHEAMLVTVTGIAVDDFDEQDEAWSLYSQFPLRTSAGGVVMAQTVYTAPSFDPVAMKGVPIVSLTGLLKQHTSSRPSTWILVPRDGQDIVTGGM